MASERAADRTIVLGGIGADTHSVGLSILRQAASSQGYQVHYMGTQNQLEDFFAVAESR